MGANRLEKFDTQIVNRQTIQEADYNPRKIDEKSAKKLRGFLRENGLWSPLVVNRQTMTLVSGHQRLAAMDALLRKPDYDLTVALIDVDEATEIKGNVFMNNPSAQGEWDIWKLEGLKDILPDLDYESDLGFDTSEISVMFGDSFLQSDAGQEEKQDVEQGIESPQEYRDIKKRTRDQEREDNESGVGERAKIESTDFSVTFIFPNNHEKHKFMRSIRKPEQETHLKSSVLVDLNRKVYDIESGVS
jgi:hypothetical protein